MIRSVKSLVGLAFAMCIAASFAMLSSAYANDDQAVDAAATRMTANYVVFDNLGNELLSTENSIVDETGRMFVGEIATEEHSTAINTVVSREIDNVWIGFDVLLNNPNSRSNSDKSLLAVGRSEVVPIIR